MTAAVEATAGVAPAAPGSISFKGLSVIGLQLFLVSLALRQFQIESSAFRTLAVVAFAGWLVHALLPLAWRLPFFAALSLVSMPVVLGMQNTLWLVGIGAILIGTCHLPIAVRWRATLLLAIGALLIAQRSNWLPVPWSEAIWPILGSIFMYRLIVYFYDLRHDRTPVTPAQSVGYFSMLPNACFPLFPVVDFKTWRRSHYSQDAEATYQRGIDWIARGILHLVLYRYFYYHLTLAPSEVDTPATLLQYVVANFMLYLRVSGLFHLVVGMLHLYGFHLPETHNRYLLASSFTDFWRRINIYWKDFMQKIFYFPAVFKLKRFGTNNAIVLATLWVFVLTWLLHSYQWFWLRGSWLLAWHDGLFWAILGVLVVVNSLIEIKRGRTRTLGQQTLSWRRVAVNVAKTYGIFWFICVLWSFWTTESITEWLGLWSALGGAWSWQVLLFPALTLVVIVLGNLPQGQATKAVAAGQAGLWRERLITLALLAGMIGISLQPVHRLGGTEFATVIHSLRQAHLSRLDNAKLERGYYEGLMSVEKFNSQLWEVYSHKPANWLDVEGAGLKRYVGGFAQEELVPLLVSSTRHGPITTNRWGLRDQDYELARPAGSFRAVVLGASSVMGWGVGDGETFEALVEQRFNAQPPVLGFSRFEFLNFGVPGYQPPQQLVAIERALKFQPQAVVFVATGREGTRSANYLAEAAAKRLPVPEPALQALLDRAGVKQGMRQDEAQRKLGPLRKEILQIVYGRIADSSRAAGARPVLVFLPQVREGSWQEETPETLLAAQTAGFEIVNLGSVYRDHDIATLRLAKWDDHPNQLGHRLVAEAILAQLKASPQLLFGDAPAR